MSLLSFQKDNSEIQPSMMSQLVSPPGCGTISQVLFSSYGCFAVTLLSFLVKGPGKSIKTKPEDKILLLFCIFRLQQ